MKNIEIDVEESICQEFENIVKVKNISLDGIMKIVMVKTIEENGVDWLAETLRNEIATKNEKKKKAIDLFRKKGFNITQYNMNFASKNKGHDLYWINPDKKQIKHDWYIILNDDKNKRIYLLYIPKNTITSLKTKNDRAYNISLTYNGFVDIHTNIDFSRFLVDQIGYNSLIR